MVDVWSVEGEFAHLIFSPKGAIEGVLITTDDVLTQFVTDPLDAEIASWLCAIKPGQTLVIEGVETGPSPKGEAPHSVYHFERLVSVNGKEVAVEKSPQKTRGVIVRLNYARHGEPNGVVLDNGDFIHTRPHGMKQLGLKIGDKMEAEGAARALATGNGRVIEAKSVNGRPLDHAH